MSFMISFFTVTAEKLQLWCTRSWLYRQIGLLLDYQTGPIQSQTCYYWHGSSGFNNSSKFFSHVYVQTLNFCDDGCHIKDTFILVLTLRRSHRHCAKTQHCNRAEDGTRVSDSQKSTTANSISVWLAGITHREGAGVKWSGSNLTLKLEFTQQMDKNMLVRTRCLPGFELV